jgi:crotonobetainyl-CoA:carnitine CoA-transferase CaiB-like acyl-CoA transferase
LTATNAGAHRVDFLDGARVLELGDGVAGAAASSVLWGLGADVTAAVQADSAHRRGRPSVDTSGEGRSWLSVVLDRGKQLITLGGTEELAELCDGGFDVVIFDRVGGARSALSPLHDVDAYAAFVERHNHTGWVTISAFGLTGERAQDVATELTVAAAGGMLAAATR